jgi:hypothetical protein
MLTQTHFTDFNIRAFKKLWKSLRGVMEHYERLTMVHEVYEEVRRYTITTFIDETSRKTTTGSKIYSFFPHNIKFWADI